MLPSFSTAARAFEPAEQTLAVAQRKALRLVQQLVRLLQRFFLALLLIAGAQLVIESGALAAQFPDRFARLLLEARLAAIQVIETARDLARELNVGHLIVAYRNAVGAIDQDIGGLQQRIAKKAISRQILVRQLFLLVLVGRYALQPAQRRHHRQQQMQFGVLRHLGLDEDGRLRWIDAGSQPIDDHVVRVGGDRARLVIGRGQRMPVGDEEQAGVLVLEFDPVGKHAMIVAKVETPGGAHAGENFFCVHCLVVELENDSDEGADQTDGQGENFAQNTQEEQEQQNRKAPALELRKAPRRTMRQQTDDDTTSIQRR